MPSGQTLDYGDLRDAVFGWPIKELLWIAGAAAVLAWLLPRVGRGPTRFGAGWFLLTLLPVVNIPSSVLVAERTLYLPSLGPRFLLAALAAHYGLGWRRFAPAAVVLADAVSAAVAVGQWRDEETLWRTTVAAHPPSPMGQMLLGGARLERWQASGTVPGAQELRAAATAFATAYHLNPELQQALVGSNFVAYRQRTGRLPPVGP